MSKSAAKYIRSCVSGRTADLLLDVLYTDRIRKNWRNADVLARFLVDTVANAYECENSTTFADNGHTDMDDAISSYIEANLCDWTQASFLASSFGQRTAEFIANRLSEAAFKNAAFEAKQKMTMTADQKAALAEGVDQFRETQCGAFLAYWRVTCDVPDTLLSANRRWCAMRDEASRWNAEIDEVLSYALENAKRPVQEDGDAVMTIAIAQRLYDSRQPCSAAEHNAHYYQLLLAKRWKEQRVIMTTKDGAFSYILNDAIAGDMVKSVSLCTYTIDFRDGSVFDLRDGDWMPHGFYASVQSKRC